jgi:hypothetical protein
VTSFGITAVEHWGSATGDNLFSNKILPRERLQPNPGEWKALQNLINFLIN